MAAAPAGVEGGAGPLVVLAAVLSIGAHFSCFVMVGPEANLYFPSRSYPLLVTVRVSIYLFV